MNPPEETVPFSLRFFIYRRKIPTPKIITSEEYMTLLQKASFCNFIRNNPWLFSACRRKKIVIPVVPYIKFFFQG
jgi:hypothetical protein